MMVSLRASFKNQWKNYENHQKPYVFSYFHENFIGQPRFEAFPRIVLMPVDRRGAHWTVMEERELKAALRAGLKLDYIAYNHARTVGAIESRISLLYDRNEIRIVPISKGGGGSS